MVALPPSTYYSPYTELELLLRPESTLLIRDYFVQTMDVDCEQLQIDGKAVVPGTAWAGLFRHKILELLFECMDKKEEKARNMVDKLFGSERKEKEKRRARIAFEEAADLNGQSDFRMITRNKIDRFTGGVLNAALFSERIAVGGMFRLGIRIQDAKDYEIGLLLLAIEELSNGLAAIGGTTAAGRGVMKAVDTVRLRTDAGKVWKALRDDEKQVYWDALDEEIREEG